jgi:hypothetical protein
MYVINYNCKMFYKILIFVVKAGAHPSGTHFERYTLQVKFSLTLKY